jgi:hypothetical protein
MKTVVISNYPSLLYSTEEAAQEDADKFKVDVCKIIHISEWNNEVKKVCLGYGLYDNGKLLSTKDFTFI